MYKFIYICEHVKEPQFYCGKHETDSPGDGYKGSSGSTEFRDAYHSGLIGKPKKIFFHEDSNVILACEHFLILSLKNAGWKLYNKNTGGGGKGKIDLALVPDEFRDIVNSIIETHIIPDIEYSSEETFIANKVYKDYLSGKYGRVFESLDLIKSYAVWQPRATLLNPKYVAAHKAEMENDLAAYFAKTDPLVILDDDRENVNYKIEGNHRTAAAIELDLQKFPISHIPFKDFKYNWASVIAFCNKLNKPKEVKQDLTPEDLRMQMAQISKQKPEIDIHSDAFEREIYGIFSQEYKPKEIEANLRIFRENCLEQIKKSERNFYIVSKKDLEETQKEILIDKDFKDACVISISSNSMMHSGVGAALHKLSENLNKKQVVVITRHASTENEDNEQNYINHFCGTLREAGFIANAGDRVFVNSITNKKVKLLLLPCRVESTKVGIRYWNSYKAAIDAIR